MIILILKDFFVYINLKLTTCHTHQTKYQTPGNQYTEH